MPLTQLLRAYHGALSSITVSDMELTDQELEEFRDIWKRRFREEIGVADARNRAMQLIELYAQLAKPLPSERGIHQSSDLCATSSIAGNPPKPKTGRCSRSSPSGTK